MSLPTDVDDGSSSEGQLHPLKSRSARNFIMSSGLESTAIALMLTALFKQAFDVTGEPLIIGIIGLLQFVPAVLLVTVSGEIADRFDRRHVANLAALGRAGCAGALAIFSVWAKAQSPGHAVWPLLAIVLVLGAVDAIAVPARHAITPLVVVRTTLPRLVASVSVTRMISRIVGPILGGYLLAIDIVTAYIAVVVLVVASMVPLSRTAYVRKPARLSGRPSFRSATRGLRFIKRSPIVFSAIALDMFAVLFGGAVALLPVIATEQLGVGDVGYGWLRAAPAIGAVVAGSALAMRPMTRRIGPALLISVGVFGLVHVMLGVTTVYPVALAALLVAGAADMISVTIRSTLVPLATPDSELGSVAAVEGVFIGASNELGAFESGVAAHWLGAKWAIAGGGFATVLIALVFARFAPSLRRLNTYSDVTPDRM